MCCDLAWSSCTSICGPPESPAWADHFRDFLDASVLYPVSPGNLMMRLTMAGLYQARYLAHMHENWIRAVSRDHPHIPVARLHELRQAVDERAKDSLVTGYEHLIAALTLPDPDDRNVLAAAIIARRYYRYPQPA